MHAPQMESSTITITITITIGSVKLLSLPDEEDVVLLLSPPDDGDCALESAGVDLGVGDGAEAEGSIGGESSGGGAETEGSIGGESSGVGEAGTLSNSHSVVLVAVEQILDWTVYLSMSSSH